MSDREFGSDWSAALAEAGTELARWRKEHPWATLDEIEDARDRYMEPVLAKMTGELAVDSPAAAVSGVRCPECQGRLANGGRRRRELFAAGGQRIGIEREYARCAACGWAGFPPR